MEKQQTKSKLQNTEQTKSQSQNYKLIRSITITNSITDTELTQNTGLNHKYTQSKLRRINLSGTSYK